MCGGIVDHSQTTRNKLLDLFLVSHCFYHAVRFEKHWVGFNVNLKLWALSMCILSQHWSIYVRFSCP